MSQPAKSNAINCEIVQDASDESVGYTPKGYQFLKEIFLVCPSCDKKLVSVVLVQKNSSKEEILQAKHVKCGVKSFKLKIAGHKFIYQGVAPFSITDIDTVDNYTEFIVK